MNTDLIMQSRREKMRRILKDRDLAGVIFFNGIRENFDSWLLAAEDIPVLQPFGRLSLYLVDADGGVQPLCAYENHPCDFPHYPLFPPALLTPYIKDHRIGAVNPECLLEVTREQLMGFDPLLSLVDVTDDFLAAKAGKSPGELEALKSSAKIFDNIFTAMPWYLREGQSEMQLAVDIRRTIGDLGVKNHMLCEDPMATTLVELTSAPKDGPAAGDDFPYPGRLLQENDRVNICVSSYLHGGFSAALGRCYILGEATEENRRYWALAVQAQDIAAAELKPGATVAAAVKKLNDTLLTPNGLAPATGNCIYGIGCSRCEAPRNVDATRDMELKAGMTLVVAPEIAMPGKDPYCCMDVYEITDNGAVRLGGTSRELRII